MGLKKALTIWYSSWYGWKKVQESSETSFFGNGLFASLGFEEVHIPMEMIRDDFDSAMDAIRASGPFDFCFVVPQHETLYWLKDAVKAPVIAWMTDDTWRHDSFCKTWMGACDLIATTDADSHARYQEVGFRSVLTNWAARAEWARFGYGVEQNAVARFHGLAYRNRKAKLEAIAASGSVPVESSWWANTSDQTDFKASRELMSEEDYHRHIAGGAFSLCLTDSSCGPKQMKGRMFEPQIHNSILVTEPAPRLDQYWSPGEECLVFLEPEEAQEEMAHLLREPFLAHKMRERAKKRLLSEHLYEHRLKEILGAVEIAPGERIAPPVKTGPERVSLLIPIGDAPPETVLFSLLGIHRALPGGTEVLLGWYGEKEPEPWLAGYAKRLEGQIVLAKAPNLASAMNALIERATGDRLVITSPDVLVTAHALKGALTAKLNGIFWIPRTIDLETGTDLAGPGALSTAPYLMACRREDAVAAGGFDESYAEGIGYEGRDFCARLGLHLGRFFGDWSRIVYRLPAPPLNGTHEALSEKNRHITMLKWKGMPFGGSPTAFTVRAEIDTSGRRIFLCEAESGLYEKARRETRSPFIKEDLTE